MQPKTHDIIISGGGMVGLALACAAEKIGLKVALIEQGSPVLADDTPDNFAPRVSAINLASECLLRNLGAWSAIPSQRKTAYREMQVWDGLGQGDIHFDAHSVQQRHLGHIIENRFICAALWAIVENSPNIDTYCEDSLLTWQQDNQSVSVTTEQGQTLHGLVLVGSEGKHSPVRQQAKIDLWQWDYQHTAIVTTVKHQFAHHQTAQQVFLESGPLAFLPLTCQDHHVSSIVWSAKTDVAHSLMRLSDADFRQALEQAFECRLGHVLHIDKRHSFALSAQQAKSYVDGRVVIVGDAAHTIHPLAGLGVNLGFLDAACLADVWQQALKHQHDIGGAFVLRRYQRLRQAHNLAVGGLMEGLKRLFDTQSVVPVLLRNAGLSMVNGSELLKRPLIMGALGQTGVALPALCRS